MWDKIKAFCLRSATIAWAYFQAIASYIAFNVDSFLDLCGQVMNDPDLSVQVKQMVPQILAGNARLIGYVAIIGSVITFACRLRSLWKLGKKIGG